MESCGWPFRHTDGDPLEGVILHESMPDLRMAAE